MARQVILIRGINVGRAKRVPMADLRTALENKGYERVSTILASGSVVLDAKQAKGDTVAADVEAVIDRTFAIEATCMARSLKQILSVVANNPLDRHTKDGSKFQAIFLSGALPAAFLKSHNPVELNPDTIRMGKGVIYQWCPDGILNAPPVSELIMKHTNRFVTARNWNTVLKIRDRMAD